MPMVNYSQATMRFSTGATMPDAGMFVRNKVIEPPVQNLPVHIGEAQFFPGGACWKIGMDPLRRRDS